MPLPHWPYLSAWLLAPSRRPPLLLVGSTTSGQAPLVEALKLLTVCEKPGNVACQQCRSCRAVVRGMHPDVVDYQYTTPTIAIKGLRELLNTLAVKPLGARRLVIIREAERLSLPAANALLKSLEEPNAANRFMLLTRWPQRLLPTIRSRCERVTLPSRVTAETAPEEPPAWPDDILQRLAQHHGSQGLTEQQLTAIAASLLQQLRQGGPTPPLRRALLRLRDYYLVTGRRGNEKLAREVLLLSLP